MTEFITHDSKDCVQIYSNETAFKENCGYQLHIDLISVQNLGYMSLMVHKLIKNGNCINENLVFS